MKLFKLTTLAGIAMSLAVTASLANANPKPPNSKRADSQAVANLYGGSTRIWKSCNGGGLYFGAGWEAKSYCNKSTPSVGIGKWSVKKGVICADLVFYWKGGESVKSKPNDKQECIAHIVDADGQMWRRWNDDADWWRVQSIKEDKNASKGFKFRSKFNRTSRKFGLQTPNKYTTVEYVFVDTNKDKKRTKATISFGRAAAMRTHSFINLEPAFFERSQLDIQATIESLTKVNHVILCKAANGMRQNTQRFSRKPDMAYLRRIQLVRFQTSLLLMEKP